jgi:nitrogen fixation-related uncharacterized protein
MTLAWGPFSLLTVWITFTVVALIGMTAVLVWAVRAGQFGDQDRARRLPLDSGIPRDAAEEAQAHVSP